MVKELPPRGNPPRPLGDSNSPGINGGGLWHGPCISMPSHAAARPHDRSVDRFFLAGVRAGVGAAEAHRSGDGAGGGSKRPAPLAGTGIGGPGLLLSLSLSPAGSFRTNPRERPHPAGRFFLTPKAFARGFVFRGITCARRAAASSRGIAAASLVCVWAWICGTCRSRSLRFCNLCRCLPYRSYEIHSSLVSGHGLDGDRSYRVLRQAWAPASLAELACFWPAGWTKARHVARNGDTAS